MKYSLMLLGLFAATGANLFGFFSTWDPIADHEEKRMVHVTNCVDYILYPSSPGQFEKGWNGVDCSHFKPYWTTEPQGYEGVLSALAKNPQWWIFVGFLLTFLTAIGIRAYQFSRP